MDEQNIWRDFWNGLTGEMKVRLIAIPVSLFLWIFLTLVGLGNIGIGFPLMLFAYWALRAIVMGALGAFGLNSDRYSLLSYVFEFLMERSRVARVIALGLGVILLVFAFVNFQKDLAN